MLALIIWRPGASCWLRPTSARKHTAVGVGRTKDGRSKADEERGAHPKFQRILGATGPADSVETVEILRYLVPPTPKPGAIARGGSQKPIPPSTRQLRMREGRNLIEGRTWTPVQCERRVVQIGSDAKVLFKGGKEEKERKPVESHEQCKKPGAELVAPDMPCVLVRKARESQRILLLRKSIPRAQPICGVRQAVAHSPASLPGQASRARRRGFAEKERNMTVQGTGAPGGSEAVTVSLCVPPRCAFIGSLGFAGAFTVRTLGARIVDSKAGLWHHFRCTSSGQSASGKGARWYRIAVCSSLRGFP